MIINSVIIQLLCVCSFLTFGCFIFLILFLFLQILLHPLSAPKRKEFIGWISCILIYRAELSSIKRYLIGMNQPLSKDLLQFLLPFTNSTEHCEVCARIAFGSGLSMGLWVWLSLSNQRTLLWFASSLSLWGYIQSSKKRALLCPREVFLPLKCSSQAEEPAAPLLIIFYHSLARTPSPSTTEPARTWLCHCQLKQESTLHLVAITLLPKSYKIEMRTHGAWAQLKTKVARECRCEYVWVCFTKMKLC